MTLGLNSLSSCFYFQRSLCREDNSASNDVHFLWKYWLEGKYFLINKVNKDGFVTLCDWLLLVVFKMTITRVIPVLYLDRTFFGNVIESNQYYWDSLLNRSTIGSKYFTFYKSGKNFLFLFAGLQSAWSSHSITEVMFSFDSY